jgi:AraC family transcriptional regulator of arabinose operon
MDAPRTTADPRITSAIQLMDAHLARPLRVEDLAAAVGLSPSRFSRLFAAQTGTSPAKYLRALRMERARMLVERTFLTIREVMARVGVQDPSHFARDFRRAHGVTPRSLRRRVRYVAPPAACWTSDDDGLDGAGTHGERRSGRDRRSGTRRRAD